MHSYPNCTQKVETDVNVLALANRGNWSTVWSDTQYFCFGKEKKDMDPNLGDTA